MSAAIRLASAAISGRTVKIKAEVLSDLIKLAQRAEELEEMLLLRSSEAGHVMSGPLCTACGGEGATLATHCPGVQLRGVESDALADGDADYRDGKWWKQFHWHAVPTAKHSMACAICGGAGGSLPFDCPGERMTTEQAQGVRSGEMAYRAKSGWWARFPLGEVER